MKKELYDRLVARREDIRIMMKKALVETNMAEFHRLNGHFQRLDKRIRKGKK